MTITTNADTRESSGERPGALLAQIREQKGYSIEYVAGKLHLRVRIIELLEADEYHLMPESVFIKGYFRAYAKLLETPAEPLIATFNSIYSSEPKTERTLWQSRRETNKAEHAVRWLTLIFATAVVISVALWWQANKDNERLLPPKEISTASINAENKSETEIRLTDLSKMRSLLSSPSVTKTQSIPKENDDG